MESVFSCSSVCNVYDRAWKKSWDAVARRAALSALNEPVEYEACLMLRLPRCRIQLLRSHPTSPPCCHPLRQGDHVAHAHYSRATNPGLSLHSTSLQSAARSYSKSSLGRVGHQSPAPRACGARVKYRGHSQISTPFHILLPATSTPTKEFLALRHNTCNGRRLSPPLSTHTTPNPNHNVVRV